MSYVQVQAMFVGPVTTLEAHRHIVHCGRVMNCLLILKFCGIFTLSEEKFAGDHSY